MALDRLHQDTEVENEAFFSLLWTLQRKVLIGFGMRPLAISLPEAIGGQNPRGGRLGCNKAI